MAEIPGTYPGLLWSQWLFGQANLRISVENVKLGKFGEVGGGGSGARLGFFHVVLVSQVVVKGEKRLGQGNKSKQKLEETRKEGSLDSLGIL